MWIEPKSICSLSNFHLHHVIGPKNRCRDEVIDDLRKITQWVNTLDTRDSLKWHAKETQWYFSVSTFRLFNHDYGTIQIFRGKVSIAHYNYTSSINRSTIYHDVRRRPQTSNISLAYIKNGYVKTYSST